MSYSLVIVESPSKCKKIEHFLNSSNSSNSMKYKCIASLGHIRELRGLESIDIHNNFAPTFTNSESKKEQISKLKKAIKESNDVILASDDDREGESIAWHLCQVFNLPIKTTKRIIFHEITESALKKAIANPIKINMNIVNAQLSRQVLDILVGYKLSPFLWHHVKDGLSAGRCQTPALRIIYENYKEIDINNALGGNKSYVITGYFTSQNIPFILREEEIDEHKVQEFLLASRTFPHIFNPCKVQTKERAAPKPFTTSSLQQACSNELHISPKETMSICQTLYEGGYITYPRTDSKIFSDEFLKDVGEYIRGAYMQEPMTNTAIKAVANASVVATVAAHEAIRITKVDCKSLEDAVTNKENRVYQLIRQRTLESCMKDAVVSVLVSSIDAPMNKEYHYSAEQIVFSGWKAVCNANNANNANNDDANNKHYHFLLSLKQHATLPYKKIKANLHLKDIKTHFSEARLVQLLEEKGIGRPSTFSSLVDKIQDRKYVKKENIKGQLLSCVDYELDGKEIIKITLEKEFGNEKNKLVIQPVGIMALEFLLEHFGDLFQYSYTKKMEEELDAVARGEKVWYDVCKACYIEIEKLASTITKRGKETIRIDENHTYMIGKYGPVIKVSANSVSPRFISVKKDIDLDKLRCGQYTLEDVVDKNNNESSVGLHRDIPVYIKAGKFGIYLEWNGSTQSLKHVKKPMNEIILEDVLELVYDLDSDSGIKEENASILRVITEDASVRRGKGAYGNYIFYRNKKMKKPRFLKLDGFVGDYLTCDLIFLQEWFKNKYQI